MSPVMSPVMSRVSRGRLTLPLLSLTMAWIHRKATNPTGLQKTPCLLSLKREEKAITHTAAMKRTAPKEGLTGSQPGLFMSIVTQSVSEGVAGVSLAHASG